MTTTDNRFDAALALAEGLALQVHRFDAGWLAIQREVFGCGADEQAVIGLAAGEDSAVFATLSREGGRLRLERGGVCHCGMWEHIKAGLAPVLAAGDVVEGGAHAGRY